MQIKKLTLKNWRSHRSTSFEFGKVNLVRGPNNSGKSSLATAIEYLLTGRCAGLPENGANADRFISRVDGVKEAKIEAVIDVNKGLQGTLWRTRSYKSGQVSPQWPISVDPDILSAVLRSGRFLNLTDKEQRELLADLVKPDPIKIPDEVVVDLKRVGAACGECPRDLSIENVRSVEKEMTALRASCTGALREIGEPAVIEERPDGAPSALDCQKRLDGLRMEQNSLVRAKETRLGAWQARQRAAREALENLPKEREVILDEQTEKKYLEALTKEPEINSAVGTMSRLTFEIGQLQSDIKNAEMKAGKCPTCGHEMVTDDLVKRYQDGIDARKSRIPTLEAIANKYPPLDFVRSQLNLHRTAVVNIAKYEKLLSETAADEAQPDTVELDAKITEIEDRIKKGQTIVAEIAAHEVRRKDYLAKTAKIKDLTERREAADRIAKWAGPDGVQKQVVGDKFGEFKGAINEVLHSLGYDLQYAETGLIIVGKFPIGTQFLPVSLSDSERWRVSVALQAAIAKVAGVGFIVLDGADILVGENRHYLVETLVETTNKAELDQVFILAATGEKLGSGKMPDFLTIYELSLDKEGYTKAEKVWG